MDDPTESNAPPPTRRPPVPLPRKSVPKRGSKTYSERNEMIGEAPKPLPEPKTKGPYAKIKSILGKSESDKQPKLPPRPTKKNSSKGSRSYGVIPRSGNQHIHERKESDSSESNGDSREGMPTSRESKDRVLGPRVPPSSPHASPTGAVPRQTSRSDRPAPEQRRSDHQVNSKRSHSRTEITTKNKLLLTAQRALEKSIRAELDVENSKYLEAIQKYQECLDDIDLVLETPLRKLKLSQRDKYEAESAVKDMKRLRKTVLEGFSDAQTAYCLPQSMVDPPAEAPPSYNDVLMEDLLENNSEAPGDASILQPISIHATSKNSPEEPPSLIDITSLSDPVASAGQGAKMQDVQQQVKKSESVKPKVKTRYPNTGKLEFPADVIVPHEQKVNFLADRNLKSMSIDSIPDSDFVTAHSTPVISPFKPPRANNPYATELVLKDVQKQLDSPNFIIDPFQNENPFAANFDSNLNDLNGDIFKDKKTDVSISNLSQKAPNLTNISLGTFAVYSSNNPFVSDLKSDPVESSAKTPCLKSPSSDTSDMFGDLANEVRKQFSHVDRPDSPPSPETRNLSMTPQPITRTVNKQQVTVQSPLGIKALNEIERTDTKNYEDHFTKRKKQAQSVMNIAESVEKESRLPNRHPLTKMKKMSRSNESLLQMFDPMKASHDSSSLSEENNILVEECQNEPQKIVNFENETEDNEAQGDNDIRKPLVDVSDGTVEVESNSRGSSETEIFNTNSKNSTLYPKLSGVELCPEDEQSNDFSSSSSSSIVEECYAVSTSAAIPERKNRVEIVEPGPTKAVDARHQKKLRPPKPVRKKVEPNGRQMKSEENSGVTIGRSAFYAEEAAKADVSQDESDWSPVFHVKDAVKLFFLTDSSVTSPFNRQTIQLLKKLSPRPGSRTGDGKVRLEVGGELFARDLVGKTTRVLMDEQGAYVIEGSEGAFICLVLTSKVDKTQILEMERMFEIYTNLAKEPRSFNLGSNNVDNAARNALKVVQKKVPGIVKTHSVRAMKKIRGAIGKEEVRQELPKEFAALKDASVQIREARMKKDVIYF